MRHQLAEWGDCVVIYSGRILRWEDKGDERWVLLKAVVAGKHEPHLTGAEITEQAVSLDHLWVILRPDEFGDLQRLERVRMMGRPYPYTRNDGTKDWGISNRDMVNTSALADAWKEACLAERTEDALVISKYLIRSWEVDGIPICNTKQSTNTVVEVHKECLRRVADYEKRHNTTRYSRRRYARHKKNNEQRWVAEQKKRTGFG
jgi:hypothetical protein